MDSTDKTIKYEKQDFYAILMTNLLRLGVNRDDADKFTMEFIEIIKNSNPSPSVEGQETAEGVRNHLTLMINRFGNGADLYGEDVVENIMHMLDQQTSTLRLQLEESNKQLEAAFLLHRTIENKYQQLQQHADSMEDLLYGHNAGLKAIYGFQKTPIEKSKSYKDTEAALTAYAAFKQGEKEGKE